MVRLYRGSCILDCDFLVDDEKRHYSSNIDLTPSIRNRLISALHIRHGCRQMLPILHFQVFFHFGSGVPVRLRSGDHIIGTSQKSNDICIRLSVLSD